MRCVTPDHQVVSIRSTEVSCPSLVLHIDKLPIRANLPTSPLAYVATSSSPRHTKAQECYLFAVKDSVSRSARGWDF